MYSTAAACILLHAAACILVQLHVFYCSCLYSTAAACSLLQLLVFRLRPSSSMQQFSTSDLLESLRYSDNQKQIQASSLAGIGARAISTSCSSDHSSQESCDSPDVQSSDPERGTRMKTSGVSDESILQFSLYYERHQCSLIVHLCRAFNVPTQCKSEASNCFVTLYLLPKKKKIFQSHVIPGTHHPKFDQVFEFAKLAAGEVHQQSLVFCIHNSHGGKDDFVGQALLSLKSSNFDGESIKLSIAEVQLDEQAKVQKIMPCFHGFR